MSALTPPVEPRAAVVVANRHDGVVPSAEAERIARHWGCELRWLDGGHVSAAILEHPAMRRASADAFARLAGRVTRTSTPLPARAPGAASGAGA